MTDYLETVLDPGENALERALRRAEAALAWPDGDGERPGEREDREGARAPAQAVPAALMEEKIPAAVLAGLASGRPEAEKGENTELAGGQGAEETPSPSRRPAGSSPLARALEEADRSAGQAEALLRLQRPRPGFTTDGPAGGRLTLPDPARPEPAGAGGELEAARRVDRAFQRDSRRYDGGFFLY